jgi:multiple sugar transport system substrate-binding protein
MVYSGADFTAAGLDPKRPPTTWEQARTDARTLTTRTGGRIVRSGMAVPSQPIARQQSYATLLWSAGGDFLSKDGKSATLDTPAASTALDFYTSLYQGGQAVDGTLGAAWSDQPPAQQPIVTGKASMELVSVESIADLRAAAPKRDIRIMPPLSLAGGEPAVFGGAANGLMINKDSRHKDLGWKFIEYMTSKDISNQYATNLGSLPIRTSASESPAVRKDPVLSQAVGYLKYARGNPNVPGWVQMRDKLDQSLERSLRGTQSPADALRQASSDLDGLLAANG